MCETVLEVQCVFSLYLKDKLQLCIVLFFMGGTSSILKAFAVAAALPAPPLSNAINIFLKMKHFQNVAH